MGKRNKILEEEIKKFKTICEYDFYIPPKERDIIDEDEDDEEEIDDYEGEMPDEPEGNPDNIASEPEGEFDDVADPEGELNNDEFTDNEFTDDELPEPEGEINVPNDGEDVGYEDSDEGGEDEVELDVSDLVNKSEEAKESSEEANDKLSDIMNKFSELEDRMTKMDGVIGTKLEDIKNDVIKRNPSEVEKLEMRSFNSYPYNLKLTDYWNDKEDNYDIGDEGEELTKKEDEEYVLTKDEVESDYSESSVRSSFNKV